MAHAAFFRSLASSALSDLDLESQLALLLAAARTARPLLTEISDDELISHFARRCANDAELSRARSGDLLLALGCAEGIAPALGQLESEILRSDKLASALSRIDSSPSFLDEVRQVVREKLLVAQQGQEPKIADYSGRGSLAAWTQVVALRAALDLRPDRAEQGSGELPELSDEQDPELKLLRLRYGKAFEIALTQAFAKLSDEQTNLLRLQIVDGLQTARIAALFRVDRSTVKRRLAECRATLLEETQRLLGETLGASPDSLESILRLVRSQLHVSVARLLGPGSPE